MLTNFVDVIIFHVKPNHHSSFSFFLFCSFSTDLSTRINFIEANWCSYMHTVRLYKTILVYQTRWFNPILDIRWLSCQTVLKRMLRCISWLITSTSAGEEEETHLRDLSEETCYQTRLFVRGVNDVSAHYRKSWRFTFNLYCTGW